MEEIIASSLFFNKTCSLPGIGTLYVETNDATTDFVNTQILAPYPSITFTAEKNEDSFNEFKAFSKLILNELNQNGEAIIAGIGKFIRLTEGKISFSPLPLPAAFTPAITAKRIIRQDAEHAILVGDKETNNVVMTEFFNETVEVKDYWWIWAIVLGSLGAALLIYYCTQYGCNNLGNVSFYNGV